MSLIGPERRLLRDSNASEIGGKDGVIGRANLWIADDFWVLRFRLMVETRSALSGLMNQKEKRSMDHFAGLDVSVKETSVCIVDETGKIVREVKVTSEPEALLAVLKNPAYHFKRIGLEAGPLSQWLFSAVAEAELPVVCVETRHMQAVLKAQINKTDRNDARGIASELFYTDVEMHSAHDYSLAGVFPVSPEPPVPPAVCCKRTAGLGRPPSPSRSTPTDVR